MKMIGMANLACPEKKAIMAAEAVRAVKEEADTAHSHSEQNRQGWKGLNSSEILTANILALLICWKSGQAEH